MEENKNSLPEEIDTVNPDIPETFGQEAIEEVANFEKRIDSQVKIMAIIAAAVLGTAAAVAVILSLVL